MASPESEAFRVCTAALNNTLANTANLNWFADRLFKEGFIDIYDGAIVTLGLNDYRKASRLTQAVAARIRTDPKNFTRFLNILQEQPVLTMAVNNLLGEYAKLNPAASAFLLSQAATTVARKQEQVTATEGTTVTDGTPVAMVRDGSRRSKVSGRHSSQSHTVTASSLEKATTLHHEELTRLAEELQELALGGIGEPVRQTGQQHSQCKQRSKKERHHSAQEVKKPLAVSTEQANQSPQPTESMLRSMLAQTLEASQIKEDRITELEGQRRSVEEQLRTEREKWRQERKQFRLASQMKEGHITELEWQKRSVEEQLMAEREWWHQERQHLIEATQTQEIHIVELEWQKRLVEEQLGTEREKWRRERKQLRESLVDLEKQTQYLIAENGFLKHRMDELEAQVEESKKTDAEQDGCACEKATGGRARLLSLIHRY